MKTIILKFAGPMQSWGTKSHFEIRQTDYYPSKSAVLGLIAAALGWKREDERIITLNSLHFAVRVDQPGKIIKDYQTAHRTEISKGKISLKTYVTNRYYIEDAVFIVALGSENAELMKQISNALQAPFFQPFMGRRSCPIPIRFLLGIYDKDVMGALEETPWQAAVWYRKKLKERGDARRLPVYGDAGICSGRSQIRRDRLCSLSHQGRRYSARLEAEAFLLSKVKSTMEEQTEHDAFAAVGGSGDVSIPSEDRSRE